MREVPKRIRNAFNELKSAYGGYIELKYLNKRFCVFEATSRYDPDIGRSRKVTHYLGWMRDDGLLIPAKTRPQSRAPLARPVPQYYTGNASSQQEKQGAGYVLDEHDKSILTALSMNPRMPYSSMSKLADLPESSLPYRIRRLEGEFDIRYTLHLNLQNLDFYKFFIFVKFETEHAEIDYEDLKQVLEGNPRVQMAMLTKGPYDIVIYCIAEKISIAQAIINEIRKVKSLSETPASWYTAIVAESYGFIPIRDAFFDVLKEKVWHRTKERRRPSGSELMLREYAVLRELNKNSTISFSEIERIYGLSVGSAKNAFEKLIKGQTIIIRPTMFMQRVPIRYNGMVLLEIKNYDLYLKTVYSSYKDLVDEKVDLVNRFAYACGVSIPDSNVYLVPVFEEDDLIETEKRLLGSIKGVESKTLIITKVILGSIGYRRFDNLYSAQYSTLLSKKNIEERKRTDYGLPI